MVRGKVETNYSIVKKMSQTHAEKKVTQDFMKRGSGFSVITNIDETI